MKFKDITVADYDVICKYCYKYGENSCQHSFVNFYTLSEKYGSKYNVQDGFMTVLRENLCDANFRIYLFPMGEGDLKGAVDRVLEDAREHGKKARFQTVTEKNKDWLLENYPGLFTEESMRNFYEYIHLSDTLIRLPGKAFESKRGDLHHFWKKYGETTRIEKLTGRNIKDLLEFEKRWMAMSVETHDEEALKIEFNEIKKQLEVMEILKISGLLLYIDDKVEGFVYGAPISEECYDVLIEKGNREKDDIYRVLHQQIVEQCASEYKYINREEDVGVEGLRKAKLSYKPEILLAKYSVSENF